MLEGAKVALPARDDLIAQLLEETGSPDLSRLTVLSAPTGYGKTRTLLHWLGEADSAAGVVWVSAHPGGAQQFWQQLAEALAPFSGAAPGTEFGTSPASGTLQKTTADAQTVSHIAAALNRPLTLVIDDYQHVAAPDIDTQLAGIAAATPRLTVVVAGRQVGLLTSSIVAARTRVRSITIADLAFTETEARALATSLGLAHTPALEEALRSTEGWPLALRAMLNLGSDSHYTAEPGAYHQALFDPMLNLTSFAMSYLELLTATAAQVILAMSLVDAIDATQLAENLSLPQAGIEVALSELQELGLAVELQSPTTTEHRAHLSVQRALAARATHLLSPELRRTIIVDRAHRIMGTAPCTGFTLLCAAGEYHLAELLLAQHFSTLTAENEHCVSLLRGLPAHILEAHPTFIAAQLFLEIPRPSAAPAAVAHLTRLWMHSLKVRLPKNQPDEQDPLYLAHVCQAMIAARLTGQYEAAGHFMRALEARLMAPHTMAATEPVRATVRSSPTFSFAGSLPTYYREMAATAIAVNDRPTARRMLALLREHAEQAISTPWQGFAHASSRTVADATAGHQWLLATLSELAHTELIEGDMTLAAQYVAEFDAHAAATGAHAPGVSWIGTEFTRAHLAYEQGRPELLDTAAARLAPVLDRLEPWPLLVMAQAGMLRIKSGGSAALTHIQSTLKSASGNGFFEDQPAEQLDNDLGALTQDANTQTASAISVGWHTSLKTFEAAISTVTGSLAHAKAILDAQSHSPTTLVRLELARYALYSGDDLTATMLALQVGDPEASLRQQADRETIVAVASWNSDRSEQAFASFARAVELVTAHGSPSVLQNVPYDQLEALAQAAYEAGHVDARALIAAMPQPARTHRYERLTEMELRTLAAIAEHRNANQAAASLFVTPGTVKKHLASVYRKLQVGGRDEAILQASRMGLLAL